MAHPWLSIRMIIAGTVLFSVYAVLMFFLFAAGGILVAVAGISIFVLLQYLFTIKLTMWRMDAEPLPIEEFPELHARADEVAKKMGIARPDLYYAEMRTMNALALGRKGNGMVFFSPPLLRTMNIDELECILAHEFAHLKNRDVLLANFGSSLSVLLSSVVLIASWIAAANSDSPKLVQFIGVIASSITYLLLMIFVRIISRYREYVADADAVRVTGRTNAMESALTKLNTYHQRTDVPDVSSNLSALCISGGKRGFLATILSTHPPMDKRIRRVQQLSNE